MTQQDPHPGFDATCSTIGCDLLNIPVDTRASTSMGFTILSYLASKGTNGHFNTISVPDIGELECSKIIAWIDG